MNINLLLLLILQPRVTATISAPRLQLPPGNNGKVQSSILSGQILDPASPRSFAELQKLDFIVCEQIASIYEPQREIVLRYAKYYYIISINR